MRVPGTYIIQYDCADLSGNAAVSVTREVFVEDTLKPTLTLETDKSQGPDILFVEAGFPYADSGATMSDSLDGVCITHDNQDTKDDNDVVCNDSNAYGTTTISGDTVDVFNNYFEKSSCAAIKAALPTAQNGRYVISPVNSDLRQIVNCFFKKDLAFTFRIFHHTNVPNCADELGTGAKLLQDAITDGDITEQLAKQAIYQTTKYTRAEIKEIIRYSASAVTLHDHEFACTQFGIPKTKRSDALNNKNAADQLSRGAHTDGKSAEAGVYKIIYDGSDVAGNVADKIYRTVIVKDTLPPVISLLNPVTGTILASGSNTALGLGDTSTPVPKYMAETTSVNGWFIGAVACAVSGVALLATSMKKTTTAVPV
jgi:hypothetical protein